jgi:endonuclease G
MLKRKYAYSVIALVFIIGFYLYDHNIFEKIVPTKEAVYLDKNQDFLPTSTTGQVVVHKYYTLSYNEKYEQAEWLAYKLTANQIVNTHFKRPYFITDKKVKTKSAHYKDYKNSGCDKGHLCPAADRKFLKEAHDETFLMSNVSPQNHQFNSGIWNRLEQKTRYWATKYDSLYIITGGVLTDDLPTIGRDKVGVPKRFYKIIFDYSGPKLKTIAFLMPNKDSEKALYKFVTSIDEIEKITKIDFFPALPDELENRLEASVNYKKWF